jgi:DNA repair ATPase RecN
VFEEDEETALSRAEKSLSSREAELQKIREDLGAASSKLKESEAKLALSLTDIELRRKTAEDTARQMTVLREENKNMSQQIKTLVGLSNQLQNELNFLKQANQGPGPALRKFDLESEIK